jgi:hypothetical protein
MIPCFRVASMIHPAANRIYFANIAIRKKIL